MRAHVHSGALPNRSIRTGFLPRCDPTVQNDGHIRQIAVDSSTERMIQWIEYRERVRRACVVARSRPGGRATLLAAGNEPVENLAIGDATSGNSLPFSTGWQGSKHIYGPIVQL